MFNRQIDEAIDKPCVCLSNGEVAKCWLLRLNPKFAIKMEEGR